MSENNGSQQGEIKYLQIARTSDAQQLLLVKGANTRAVYAEEVSKYLIMKQKLSICLGYFLLRFIFSKIE